jgi:hypothetical protein
MEKLAYLNMFDISNKLTSPFNYNLLAIDQLPALPQSLAPDG